MRKRVNLSANDGTYTIWGANGFIRYWDTHVVSSTSIAPSTRVTDPHMCRKFTERVAEPWGNRHRTCAPNDSECSSKCEVLRPTSFMASFL